jgi:glutamate/tyrosine decarboxylase-like PLP-dependent enzyme
MLDYFDRRPRMSVSHQSDPPATDPFALSAKALDHVHQLARRWIAGLGTQQVSRRLGPQEMAELLDEPLPERGADPLLVAEEWFVRAEPGIVASPGPRFFGFVNGGSSPAALAGDWLASAIDQNAGFWLSSPAAAQTELVVLRWLKELFGLPSAWSGAMTSGATMSNLVGLAAARQWVGLRLGFDPAVDGLAGHPVIPVVSSTEIHASALKSLGTLGLGRGAVRLVDAPGGSVDLAALKAELTRIDGPVIVVANAGEVNTGAFDSLSGVADICAAHPGGAWMHVDGAFGLFAAASPQYAHLIEGIDRADSVAADGHKWLNVPYDSGFAFVRDVDALRAAFNAIGSYIAPTADTGWDPASHVPEMSRRFRGLAAWCALRAWGRVGYSEMVERCCANASAFADWVDAQPGLELLAPAPLNIVCFRYIPDHHDAEATDAFNQSACSALQRDGRVFVTATRWNGHAAIRAAFDNWATTEADVRILTDAVSDVGVSLLGD